MFQLVGVLAVIVLIGWVIYRATSAPKMGRQVKDVLSPHVVMYGLACVAGVCALAYFLGMNDISKFIKVITSVVLGIVLIVVASLNQRKTQVGDQ